jgi:6-pyruvoyltetrahydropterin/6-carboxytetrahydropterin synthase
VNVSMTRRVTFSSGHRYWLPALTPEENREKFGKWASPYNHGHNYILDATVSGRVNETNGMVVNIKVIDDILKGGLVTEFDQKSLNDEVPYFANRSPSLENLLIYVRERLLNEGILPSMVQLDGLRLEEMPTLWASWTRNSHEKENEMISLTRSYEFAASHRLHAPALSGEENLALFGKCNNPMGHGHNYVLEVTITGEPDPTTGMIADLTHLDTLVHQLVVDRYDHKNLNEDIEEFAGKPTTSEKVAAEIFRRLDGQVPARLAKVRLWETARNAFEVTSLDPIHEI